MAPHKIVIFLGRLGTDTGFVDCINICRKKNYQLEVYGDGPLRNLIPSNSIFHGFVSDPDLSKADFVYTTGYLGILEACLANKKVFWSWDNPIKEDIIKTHPTYKKSVNQSYVWAKKQTWQKLANIYEKLWQK